VIIMSIIAKHDFLYVLSVNDELVVSVLMEKISL
jgi:hypothetical protein